MPAARGNRDAGKLLPAADHRGLLPLICCRQAGVGWGAGWARLGPASGRFPAGRQFSAAAFFSYQRPPGALGPNARKCPLGNSHRPLDRPIFVRSIRTTFILLVNCFETALGSITIFLYLGHRYFLEQFYNALPSVLSGPAITVTKNRLIAAGCGLAGRKKTTNNVRTRMFRWHTDEPKNLITILGPHQVQSQADCSAHHNPAQRTSQCRQSVQQS